MGFYLDFYQTCFAVALVICSITVYFANAGKGSLSAGTSTEFKAFQQSYLVAYYCAMAGDWLQGPYVYALYDSYGYSQIDIATLFVAGFGSSMIFGTFVGSLADKMGRKKMAQAYCIIYIASCVTKHFSGYWMLMLGRFLGGIATSLVYSVFDSWMVSEHNAKGFNGEWLGGTFSRAIQGNSIVAILSGIVAEFATSLMPLSSMSSDTGFHIGGFTAPFDVAIFFLLICFLFISSGWSENYGATSASDSGLSLTAVKNALAVIAGDKKVFLIGCICALFEGSMFTFVFMWTPVLKALDKDDLPFGLIFATFMLCCMAGSALFGIMAPKMKMENILFQMLGVATISLCAPWLSTDYTMVFICFLLFEACVGVYWPSMGTIKGQNVPDSQRAAIYNVYRVPLNAIVLFVLEVEMAPGSTFFCVVLMLAMATFLQSILRTAIASNTITKSAPADLEQQKDAAMTETSNDATV